MSTKVVQLYAPLLNEGTDVLRPVTGVFVSSDTVRVESPADYNPDNEEWEFPPGSEVHCLAEVRDGKQILVARSTATALSQRA